MYERAKSEAIGKARSLRRTAYEIADIAAMKYNLTNKERLRLREQVAAVFVSQSTNA